jgi:uncharacterized protein (DUF2141 family)
LRLFFAFLLATFLSFSATLKVDISGVRSSKGAIYVGLFKDPKTFLTVRGVYRWIRVRPKRGNVSCKFRNLPKGRYAVALFHDENGNEELDLTPMGFPKEGYAISGKVGVGMPKFKDCSFFIHPKKRYRIRLKMNY